VTFILDIISSTKVGLNLLHVGHLAGGFPKPKSSWLSTSRALLLFYQPGEKKSAAKNSPKNSRKRKTTQSSFLRARE
jgi:hypothetical protein